MSRGKEFSKALVEARKAHGFPSAYAFYRARAGNRTLGMTFGKYLGLEKGRSLPKPFRLERLLSALGLLPSSRDARALVRAYLTDLMGSEVLLKPLLEAGPAGAAISDTRSFEERAAKQALDQRRVELTMDQLKLLASSLSVHVCQALIKTSAEGYTIAGLARAAAVPVKEAKRAVAALERAKLAKLEKGKVFSPYVWNQLGRPKPTAALAGVFGAYQKYRAVWQKRGSVVHASNLIIRTPRRSIERYFEHMDVALEQAGIYADNSKREGSGLYLIEGRVTRLPAGD